MRPPDTDIGVEISNAWDVRLRYGYPRLVTGSPVARCWTAVVLRGTRFDRQSLRPSPQSICDRYRKRDLACRYSVHPLRVPSTGVCTVHTPLFSDLKPQRKYHALEFERPLPRSIFLHRPSLNPPRYSKRPCIRSTNKAPLTQSIKIP